MKTIGVARRGDVVLIEMGRDLSALELHELAESVQPTYDETGVRFVFLGAPARVAQLKRHRIRARHGATPRWCRRP